MQKSSFGHNRSTLTYVFMSGVMDMNSITHRMDENQKIAKDLKEETSVFTNV